MCVSPAPPPVVEITSSDLFISYSTLTPLSLRGYFSRAGNMHRHCRPRAKVTPLDWSSTSVLARGCFPWRWVASFVYVFAPVKSLISQGKTRGKQIVNKSSHSEGALRMSSRRGPVSCTAETGWAQKIDQEDRSKTTCFYRFWDPDQNT